MSIIRSQLQPIQRPSFKKSWKKLSRSVNLIFEDKNDEIKIIELSNIVYLLCSYNRSKDIINNLQEMFIDYFKSFLKQHLEPPDFDSSNHEELAKEYINKAGIIMPHFNKISAVLNSIFFRLKQFANYDVLKKLNETLVNIIEEEDYSKYILLSIITLFDVFLETCQIDTFTQDKLFNDARRAQLIFSKLSPEKLRNVKYMLKNQCETYFRNFMNSSYQDMMPPQQMQQSEDEEKEETEFFSGSGRVLSDEAQHFDPIPHIVAFCSKANELCELEYQLVCKMFDNNLGDTIRNTASVELTNPDSDVVKLIISEVKTFMKNRNLEDFKVVFKMLNPNTYNLSNIVSQICEQIALEPYTIKELPEVIEFYKSVSDLLSQFGMENVINIKKSLIKLVNKDCKATLKGLLKVVNDAAFIDPDITKYIPVISMFQMKTEFELSNIRHAARRLTKGLESQIENEIEIKEQLSKVDPPLQLESLQSLIYDAQRSLRDNHYGPVLILNSRSWPYKPPYPQPIALSSISSKISKDYLKNHETRELKFPINYWIVNVKDTLSSIVYNGTGVQAEILLYFNDHKIITDTSLEPRISQSFLRAALKAMSHKDSPILVGNDGVYSLNSNWHSYDRVIKLKAPAIKDEVQIAKNNEKAKGDTIEALIVKRLKQIKISNFHDITQYIKENLSSRFAISNDDVKKAIDQLINRSYLEELESGRLGYIS